MILLSEIDYSKDFKEWSAQIDDNWKRLTEVDRQAKENGQLLGRYIDHPYADGKAIYIIIKENKNTVRIEVCGGLGDDWVLPAWGDVATIPKETALQFIKGRDFLKEKFDELSAKK